MHKIKPKYFQSSFAIILLFFYGTTVFAQAEIPPKPTEQTSVYDGANLFSGFEKNALEQKLIKYADSTSTQIVVATVKTINGEDIGEQTAYEKAALSDYSIFDFQDSLWKDL